MAVKRIKTEGYEVKASGRLVEINQQGLIFEDDKTGRANVLFSELQALVGQEVTFGFKRVEKEEV